MEIYDYSKYILPSDQNYTLPGTNEIKFITHKQTLSLVLGSCISTVFIGKKDVYILAANHIVIAIPPKSSIIAKKSAIQQIEEIIMIYEKIFKIPKEELICLHVVGAGSKNPDLSFTLPQKNIDNTIDILRNKNYNFLFQDTGSYFFSTFSIYNNHLSVFIENKLADSHISYTIDLDQLFRRPFENINLFPASGLNPPNKAFEYLINNQYITFITGARIR